MIGFIVFVVMMWVMFLLDKLFNFMAMIILETSVKYLTTCERWGMDVSKEILTLNKVLLNQNKIVIV